jgi:outer membrane protein assembly factor BamA
LSPRGGHGTVHGRDIRLEGIQRVEAGTVFSYLPVKVGDTMTDDKAAQAIKTCLRPVSSRTSGSRSMAGW